MRCDLIAGLAGHRYGVGLHLQILRTVKIAMIPCLAHFGCRQIKIPTSLGLKSAKWITAMFVSKRLARGLWEHRGYSWFAGV
jgi:hypothetical protein